MKIMFSKSSRSIMQADVNSLLELIGYSFPKDFVEFYLSVNGGVSDRSYFYAENDDDYVEVSFFLPLKYPNEKLGNMTIETTYETLIKRGIPKYYLPFAIDWGGNYFSIDLRTNDIVLLLMDLGSFTDDAVKNLINGFSIFINNLEEEMDE